MSQTIVDPVAAVAPAAPVKPSKPAEAMVEATTEALTKGGAAAEKIVKENAATLAESGTAAGSAFQELAKAYQDLATKNAKNLTAAIQSLSAIKSVGEFIELEQRLIKEGVEAAIADSKNIARLTAAVFTAAIDPVKKRMEAARK
jgi:hypothetical protein